MSRDNKICIILVGILFLLLSIDMLRKPKPRTDNAFAEITECYVVVSSNNVRVRIIPLASNNISFINITPPLHSNENLRIEYKYTIHHAN